MWRLPYATVLSTVFPDGKIMLKKGITTGTCAAAAAKGAARFLFSHNKNQYEDILLPSGDIISIKTEEYFREENSAGCCVKKYSGDDPDITDGILIYAFVKLTESDDIVIKGGKGVGVVTKPGLEQPVGEAAINKVPRAMIKNSLKEIFSLFGYNGGGEVTISVPQGEEAAKKTFNPCLGIEGGISILGTTGIVEPMSTKAIIDTIRTEIKFRKENYGDNIVFTPGNYGRDFIKNNTDIDPDSAVTISNYPGEALDIACEEGIKNITIIGHSGKLVKLAGGIMNTHSREADCRMEIIAANTLYEDLPVEVSRKILNCVTTDEAVEILIKNNVCRSVMDRIAKKAAYYCKKRCGDNVGINIVIFSCIYGILGVYREQ